MRSFLSAMLHLINSIVSMPSGIYKKKKILSFSTKKKKKSSLLWLTQNCIAIISFSPASQCSLVLSPNSSVYGFWIIRNASCLSSCLFLYWKYSTFTKQKIGSNCTTILKKKKLVIEDFMYVCMFLHMYIFLYTHI